MRFRHFAISLVAGVLLWQPVSCTKCSKSETTSQKSAAVSQAKSSKQKQKRKQRKRPQSMGTRTVEVEGEKRRYSVQGLRRSKSNKSNKAPVLLALHDTNRSSRDFTRRSDIRGGARKLGYILAVPTTGKQGWGPGLCPQSAKPGDAKGASGKVAPAAPPANVDPKAPPTPKAQGAAATSAMADVQYIRAVLDDLEKKYQADPKRVYVLGMGAGAAFAETLVSELPGRIAGVVAVDPPNDCPRPGLTKPLERPVPTLVMTASGKASKQAEDGPASQGIGYWLKANGCSVAPSAGSNAKKETQYDCKKGRVVKVAVNGSRRKFPRKVGRLYSVRYLDKFFH